MIPLANHSGCKQTNILYLKKIRVSRGKTEGKPGKQKKFTIDKEGDAGTENAMPPRSEGVGCEKLVFVGLSPELTVDS